MKKKVKKTRFIIISSAILMVAVAVVFALVAYFTHNSGKTLPQTASQTTNGEPTTNSQSSTSTTTNSSTTQSALQPGVTKNNNVASSTFLEAPNGDFVSNHTPGQNGSPTTETSVCNTTPGATCAITFSLNGITKSLPSETTDLGGSVYWNDWLTSSIGLTKGSWQIKAIATLNGQSKSTVDQMNLEISE